LRFIHRQHVPAATATTRLLTPPDLGLVRLRIPGFARLTEAERLQAAALALHRDYGIAATGLQLATAAGSNADEARVAYCVTAASPANSLGTTLLGAMHDTRVYWVDAPEGYVISAQGAVALDGEATSPHALPQAVQMSLGAASELVLVRRDITRVSRDTLALWAAASGAAIVDGELPASSAIALRPVPRARIDAPPGAVDRSLRFAAVAAIACVVLVSARLLTAAPAVAAAPPAAAASTDGNAGPLFDRIAWIAPDLLPQLQGATYASGAWVLELPAASDAGAVQRIARVLESNGLAVQTTRTPAPRLRVQLAR